MANGSFLLDRHRSLIERVENLSVTDDDLKAIAKLARDETKRADDNAARSRELQSQIDGMVIAIRAFK